MSLEHVPSREKEGERMYLVETSFVENYWKKNLFLTR
jgi:hypothetical protein